jgi:hypothetical protein
MDRRDEAFTDALADLLFGLDLNGLPTSGVTRSITVAVVRWAHDRGWVVRTESRVELVTRDDHLADRLGFVDVVVRRGEGRPSVAIEIDSTDKPWSVVKLQHAAAAGMHAIWVRWGDDAWAGVYDDVDVIQLRASRLVKRRAANGQLTAWQVKIA